MKFILNNLKKTVCFTGPRPTKLPDGCDPKSDAIKEIIQKLEAYIRFYASQGKTTFLNGCMAGFDVLAGEAVLYLKKEIPQLVCVTVAPFRVQYFTSRNWTPEWKARALALYRASDHACSLSETYHKGVYYERDEYLIDHSSAVVCYYAGTGGGTKYTLDYAAKKGLEVRNLYDAPWDKIQL